jgi:hypothetical protein
MPNGSNQKRKEMKRKRRNKRMQKRNKKMERRRDRMNKGKRSAWQIIEDAIAISILGAALAGLTGVTTLVVRDHVAFKAEKAAVERLYKIGNAAVALCDKSDILPEGKAIWNSEFYGRRNNIYLNTVLGKNIESPFVIVEQNLPLPVAGTGYDAVMPKDHKRYVEINRVFNYIGDVMGKEFIVVDDRAELLSGMTADMMERIPVWELYLAIDEGRYMGYPVAAWGDGIRGILGIEVWWWYSDDMWDEGGTRTILHEAGHMLGLGHVGESAGDQTVMGGTKDHERSFASRTFGLHDLAGLQQLWCNDPTDEKEGR